ncbi:hypothetical protein LVJ94_34610 [Pendulispora rubella]|uniref:Uncharacterized protein n=1 Tax=Pendulispora rubella TaxID=2741070 RepID=A0ABZ2KTN1_9BACT
MFTIAAKKKTSVAELRTAGVLLRRRAERFEVLYLALRIHAHAGEPGPDGIPFAPLENTHDQVVLGGPGDLEAGIMGMIAQAHSTYRAITPVWDVFGIGEYGAPISVAADVTENEDRWLTVEEDRTNRERIRELLEPSSARAKELAAQGCREFAESIRSSHAKMELEALGQKGVFISDPHGKA